MSGTLRVLVTATTAAWPGSWHVCGTLAEHSHGSRSWVWSSDETQLLLVAPREPVTSHSGTAVNISNLKNAQPNQLPIPTKPLKSDDSREESRNLTGRRETWPLCNLAIHGSNGCFREPTPVSTRNVSSVTPAPRDPVPCCVSRGRYILRKSLPRRTCPSLNGQQHAIPQQQERVIVLRARHPITHSRPQGPWRCFQVLTRAPRLSTFFWHSAAPFPTQRRS
jgi:hypothetical protein